MSIIDGKEVFEIDDKVKALNDTPLSGNFVAPPVVIGEEYRVLNIVLDRLNNQHLDLGFKSRYNWITSWDTGEVLPDNGGVHWVHPSRVILIK